MDYDDNDAQDQNLDLAEEGSSKISPVLHSYTLPKFDFDDNLQGHLRFDSLVENEVFLGITSQEDNQWIEEYSRGTSAIPFSSSAGESRHQNVWSEATSSESVEMLLKSVGQEEKVVDETIVEELDAYDRSASLTSVMDTNIKQCDGNDHVINNRNAVVQDEFQENFVGSKVSAECEQSHDTFTLQHQETQVSCGELDSDIGDKYGGEEKVDKICDDSNQEGSNLVKESFVNELQEDLSVSMVECGIDDSSQNVDATIEECQENPQEGLETLDENASNISKNFSSSEPEHFDKICDDANQEGSNLANESPVNDLQEDPSVSKCGHAGYLQNVDGSVDECEKSPQEAPEPLDENASDLSGKFHSSEPEDINKMCDDASQVDSKLANELQEDFSVPKVECGSGGVSQNVDASVEEYQENRQEALETLKENTSDLSKNFHSSESEHIHMICDNADQEGSNLADESFVNDLLEGPSVSKVKCGSSDSIQNVDASVEECQENPQEIPETCNENATDQPKFPDSPKSVVGSLSGPSHAQGHSVVETEKGVSGDCQQVTSPDSRVSSGYDIDKFEMGEGSEINNVTRTSIEGRSSAEMPAEDILNKDEATGNSAPDIHTGDLNESSPVKISGVAQGGDEIPSLEPNAVSMDQDFTFSERGDTRLSLDSRYMDIDVSGASDGQKNGEPSSSDGQKNVKIGDETQSSEPDAASMHQDFTLKERGDARLPMESKYMDIDVFGASDGQKNVEPTSSDGQKNVKISGLTQVGDETQSSEPDAASMHQDFTLNERGDARLPMDSRYMDINVFGASDGQKNVDPSSSDGQKNVKIPGLTKVGDETQSSEPDAASMHQYFTLNERGDARSPMDIRDVDMNVAGAPDGQKNVDLSSSAEVCEGFIAMAQGSEPNMTVLTDADAAAAGSSKVSSPDTLDGMQLSSGTVAGPDIDTEDQPKSSILGVSLLHDNNEEQMEVGFSNEGSCQKGTTEVDSAVICALQSQLPSETVAKADIDTENQPISPILGVSLFTEVDSTVNCALQSPLSSETVAKADIDTENQPISPILGVSLLHDHKEEKLEVEFSSEESCQKGTPEADSKADRVLDSPLPAVEKDTVSDGAEKAVHGLAGHYDVSPSEQTTDAKNAEAGGQRDLKESMTGEDGVEPLNLTVNISDEQKTSPVADPSERDSSHDGLKISQTFSFSDTQSIEPTQSAEDKLNPTKGSIEKAPLSLTSPTKEEEKSFTFEVTGQTSIQNLGLSKNMSPFDPNKLHQDSLGSPQTPSEGSKPRRKRETTTTKRSRREKSTSPATGHLSPVPLQPNESIDSSTPKPGVIHPISTSSQPDLSMNNSIFHQSFTDYQQVQLRAQILVYGSLISGVAPEEPHMIAAFGQSDNGRRAWEAAWHACVQRVHGQKSQVNTPDTPLQGIKIGSAQSKIFTTPLLPVVTVSPLNPISSPLWNISTPRGHLQSSPMPRTGILDYRQTVSPLHPYQTPQVQNFSGHNSPWLSPVARFSPLPITESVKLTTVKESAGQPSNDSKNRKRKKMAASQTPVLPSQPQMEGHHHDQILVVPSHSPTAVDLSTSTPVSTSTTSKSKTNLPVNRDEIMTKIEESKLQAADAAGHAATAVNHCQDVWTQLKIQKTSGLVSDDEAKLASSAASIAAAASVAKVAAAAAKIASDVAEQARLMADEVFISSNENVDKTDHGHGNSTSIISVAREAARRRIEAASAASKHAENLDAIVKAAELAAEAVSQAGKIVSMGNPLPIQKLIESGPEGYWKTPQASEKQKVQTLNDKDSVDKTTAKVSEGPESSKTPESINVNQNIPESTSFTNIKEGTLVEVYKDDNKNKGAWFAANVLSLKDGKAFVCYTEIQSDEGSDHLKEWVPLEVEDNKAPPKIRVAHPMTTLRFDASKKRGRTVFSDYSWCSGDRVDVWVHDSWHEAVVVETNKIDVTSLTVQFPGQGKTSIVRSWHLRPTLIWKDKKWVEWSSLKGHHSSEGDTPQEKRHKFDKEKITPWNSDQESRIPTLKGSLFDVGKSNKDENKLKEGPRVVFGVPKPGRKQKFMDVSKHYVADVSNKSNNTNTLSHSHGLKNKQVAEIKSKALKFRKPPIPSVVRTLGQKDKSKSSASVKDSEDLADQQKETGAGSNEDNVPLNTSKQSSSTSIGVSSRLNKRKFTPGNVKSTAKVEVKDKLTSEAEPRRSSRKIQPTSRLLEGLQSSLTVSKMPSVSHASQRSHNKVISKGSSG